MFVQGINIKGKILFNSEDLSKPRSRNKNERLIVLYQYQIFKTQNNYLKDPKKFFAEKLCIKLIIIIKKKVKL
jgi:hypothetical protein